MNASRFKLAISLAIPAYGAGLIVWWFWPWLQASIAPHLPDGTNAVTGWIAYWGIYLTVGAMTLRVLPPYHRARIIFDFIGLVAFLVNLLLEKNSGNVAMEVGLIIMTGWSLWLNRLQHTPITASKKEWLKAIAMLALCYGFGLGVAWLWPVNSQTQYQGWYWPYVGLSGALFLFSAIVMLETRVIRGDQWEYPAIYGVGCVLLWASYLGEYNLAGLVINSSLACLMYVPLAWRLVRK